jgi:2-dehydropantoate 2-reductase
MKITIIGGTGAMGLIFGTRLAQAGYPVTLLDVNKDAIHAVNTHGAKITNKDGTIETITAITATSDATSIGIADVVIVFTKCYWTEEAMENAKPIIGPHTTVLSLQNGWGNYDVIASVIPSNQIMVGVNYVSGTTLAAGHAKQVGNPIAYIGRVGLPADAKSKAIGALLDTMGVKTTVSDNILFEVFQKLALNAATLPTSALIGLTADKLITNEGTIQAMDDILNEMALVVKAQGVTIDVTERRTSIHNLLKNAIGARGSMLQDVDAKRKTEIDVINGAIVSMGRMAGIPTPVNQTFVNMIKALESTFF